MNKSIDDNIGPSKSLFVKQVIVTTVMVIVSVFVITVATYAWFKISNTPKIESVEFTADTIGNLQISNVKNENGNISPEKYGTKIGLFDGVSDNEKNKMYLSPVTTDKGIVFYKPVYASDGSISSMESLDSSSELFNKKYVYVKKFYLRAGENNANVDSDKAKSYEIFLTGKSKNEADNTSSFDKNFGSYLRDVDAGDGKDTAANAIRVSFDFTNVVKEDELGEVLRVYEPNCDKSNNVKTDSSGKTNIAEYNGEDKDKYGKYTTIKQMADKSFVTTYDEENDKWVIADKEKSSALCTIKEGQDVFVTMRIWIEGMDKDCINEIAADKMEGQIQFISKELEENN